MPTYLARYLCSTAPIDRVQVIYMLEKVTPELKHIPAEPVTLFERACVAP